MNWASYLLLVLFFFEGRSSAETRGESESEFQPYVQRFKWAAEKYSQVISFETGIPGLSTKKLVISPAAIRSHAILGACTAKQNEIPRITVNENEWGALSDLAREQLIFHELGHCALSRAHVDDVVESKGKRIPRSIMSSTAISDSLYENYRDYYYSELFYGAISR